MANWHWTATVTVSNTETYETYTRIFEDNKPHTLWSRIMSWWMGIEQMRDRLKMNGDH